MIHPTVFNTSQICHQLGVNHAVFSPGSRNAPLTISFARNKNIKKWIIPDERAAGFIALGIAQETKSPVVLSCTSGTALLNYAPAIAEAYYREIPLIVLSADRPPELIDQRDGQTIRQFEALKNHVLASYQLPLISSEETSIQYQEILIEAIQLADGIPKGPVHINVPFKEPFYPTSDQSLSFKKIEITPVQPIEYTTHGIDLDGYKKILILVGQQDYDQKLDRELAKIADKVPVVSSPLNNLSIGITQIDAFVNNQSELQPDLLITSGLSVLSKKLKIFLRNHKPKRHLHLDPAAIEVDTFGSSPEFVRSSLIDFIGTLDEINPSDEYLATWKRYSDQARSALNEYLTDTDYSETKATWHILQRLPQDINLHVSNSMPVRFVDLFGVKPNIQTFSNRGTSGIDGCTSTALGASIVSDKLNVLLTGDLAFLYDRNAFFHNLKSPHLRIIVMNNSGGGIFRLIDGPSQLDELEVYFETRHNRTAKYICKENELEYIPLYSEAELKTQLSDFWEESDNAKVMEIFTKPETNQRVYKELRNFINERIKN